MKLTTLGTWWIQSKSDPRWNISGRSEVGLMTMPQEARALFEKMKELYGEPPDDLEQDYMKD